MKYKQAEFRRVKDNCWRTGWFKADRQIKEGSIVTLKDSSGKWKVVKIYDIEVDGENISREWNVGGLDSKE